MLLAACAAPLVLACAKGSTAPDSDSARGSVAVHQEAATLVSVSDGWLAMGTFFEAEFRVPPEQRLQIRAWLVDARREIARFERVASRHDPASELSALNIHLGAPGAGALQLSDELAALVDAAAALHAETGGRFDVSIGPLVSLWWAAAARGALPTEAELRAARSRVGLSAIARFGANGLRVQGPGSRLDLDGLSKGFVLDRLAADLDHRFPGVSALLTLGPSSVIARGTPTPGQAGWRLAVQERGAGGRAWAQVELRDEALSVSSSRGTILDVGGRVFSHIIDPRTGRPVAGQVESAVIGTSAAAADAWSTALLVSPDEAALIETLTHLGLEARVFGAASGGIETPGWSSKALPPASKALPPAS